MFLNNQWKHCRIQPKEIQPGHCWTIKEERIYHQHQADGEGKVTCSGVLKWLGYDEMMNISCQLVILKEMKEQMSSPTTASVDRKNKQVTLHTS